MTEAPIAETYLIEDLAQLKILADPLRVRILESFAEEARTTKQVAQRLGEKPTKLYHHVDALEKAGFLRLERTRQNRGTLEKYFRAVAKVFRAAPSLFQDSGDDDSWPAVSARLLEQGANELRAIRDPESSAAEQALIASFMVAASVTEIAEIREGVQKLLDEITEPERPRVDPDKPAKATYRLIIGFYPVAEGQGEA